ncbi:MAG TPA: RNA polymerase sigma factor SigM [Mycobacteriales bacterium]|nr:RNA polymerase sigma factor SigM [Mycobacteriales bacterium]
MSRPVDGPAAAATSEVDDRELLRRHVSGDRDAFPALVRRHQDRLWRVALRTLGDPDDAADALQDALLSAYRAAAGYRGDAAVTTWLHRIVVNACLDLARRRASRPTRPLDETAAARQPAADRVEAWETASDVLAALRELPVEQAAAIVLVDVEGYPVADVATMLEVPIGTVKSRCARGRARLAATLVHLDPRNPAAAVPVQPDSAPRADGPAAGGLAADQTSDQPLPDDEERR